MSDERKIAIGCDHGGWELKEAFRKHLLKSGYCPVDFGVVSKEAVDYPDIGHQVSREVSSGKIARGILICGTGIGMSIVANRYQCVRAALCHNLYTARLSREHNDANLLVLGARVVGEGLALEILDCWLATKFEAGRHLRRINKI